jgi:Flp pilus assembly protein CpaB
MQAAPATNTPGVKTVAVLVAASDMDLGAEVRREDLRAIQWPAGAVPMGAFSNPDELVGRGLIQPVAQNEAFPAGKAGREGSGRRAAADHPRGLSRALGAGERRRGRGRLRPARDARRRRGHGQSDAAARGRADQGDSHQRAGY